MESSVKIDLKGWNNLVENVKILQGTINVGILDNGESAKKAAINHFGLVTEYAWGQYKGDLVKAYPRPFITDSLDRHIKDILEVDEDKLISKNGGKTILHNIGQKAQYYVQDAAEYYEKYDPWSNSAKTIENKGFNDPLRGEGEMIEDIKYEVIYGN